MKLQLVSKVYALRSIERVFQLTFVAADNYVTGGITLDFTKMINAVNADRGQIPAFVGPGTLPPAATRFRINQVPAGYDGEVIVNTVAPTIKNYLFKILSSGGTEIAAAGIPVGIYGDINGFTISVVTPKYAG